MRPLVSLALATALSLPAAAHAADVKAPSHIDAVTVYRA